MASYDQDAVDAVLAVIQPQLDDIQAQIAVLLSSPTDAMPLPNQYIIRYPNGEERVFDLVEVVPV